MTSASCPSNGVLNFPGEGVKAQLSRWLEHQFFVGCGFLTCSDVFLLSAFDWILSSVDPLSILKSICFSVPPQDYYVEKRPMPLSADFLVFRGVSL